MKCQILFSGKNKKNVINLKSAEFAQWVVEVKVKGKACFKLYLYKVANLYKVWDMKKQDENIQKGFRRKSVDFCRSVSYKGSAYNEFCLKLKDLDNSLTLVHMYSDEKEDSYLKISTLPKF